jgi:hypothetical protein
VLTAYDEAEFGMRLLLKFIPEEGEDDQDEDDERPRRGKEGGAVAARLRRDSRVDAEVSGVRCVGLNGNPSVDEVMDEIERRRKGSQPK